MKNIRFFLSESFQFLVVKFSIYLNRHVFVMTKPSIAPMVPKMVPTLFIQTIHLYFLPYLFQNFVFHINSLLMYQKYPLNGNQCRPRSGAAICGIWFQSTQAAQHCLFTALPSQKKNAYVILTPRKPHFYLVKLWFAGVFISFLTSAQKQQGCSNEYPQSLF